ncbi:MAG: EAL domain-containing protein [Hyphomicrobiaceae bacterium]
MSGLNAQRWVDMGQARHAGGAFAHGTCRRGLRRRLANGLDWVRLGGFGFAAVLVLFMLALLAPAPAAAMTPIAVTPETDHIEITTLGEAYEGRGDALTVDTVAGGDGVSGRMSVKAATAGTNPNWIVFALTNPTDKAVELWLTADRYTLSGSGIVWPDLDARRIEAVTPSIGFVPSRINSDRADIFALTLEAGQTITYAAELSSERFARVHLWKPLNYEVRFRERQLFNGIMLGLSVLTALFLTVIFAANHKLIFPAAALFSWCVLAYLCVDFGFFHKIFNMKPEDNAVYRAAAESAMAASLVMFLYAFLRLGLTHGLIRMLLVVWILAQLSLIAVAAIDPRLAATFARFSFLLIGGVGGLATLYLAIRGQDRAMHLLPPWILFLVWIFLAGVTLTGRLSGDIFVSALIGGLVLILLLIGFVVTQFAFRSLEPLAGLAPTDSQLRAIAVDGARSAVWEWSSRRDEIKTGDIVEMALGLNPGEFANIKVDEFLQHIHAADRERFRLSLWSVQERAGGKIRSDFRMRHMDGSYRWFELEAAAVESGDRRAVRCVGLMRDITETKMAKERLLKDAVHCKLTGLPNRELLNDRLSNAVLRARSGDKIRPTIFFIDIDKFKRINDSLGYGVGDSLLLNVARRLQRHIGPHDTLARISGDQFAILFIDQQDARELAGLAERVRLSLRAPMRIAGQEVVLTGSLGIAIFDGGEKEHGDLLKEAEIAMYRAKRSGIDRIEIFRPEMRGEPNERDFMEATLRRAVEKDQVKVFYQPIVYLPTEQLAGFEALARLEHPKLGLISPGSFISIAEESDLIVALGSRVLNAAAAAAAVWQKELPRLEDELFVSVNVSSRQVLKTQLVQETRHVIGKSALAKGTLRLEITESLAMENPEHAIEILTQIQDVGVKLALDDFGTGYSSLAYLQRLPFDTIKLDRELIKAAGGGEEAASAIVRAMVALAHELGKDIVAEGIENAEDVVFLRSIGCEYGQGYFYGEPMSERDVIELLRIIRKSERKLQTHGFFKTKQRRNRKKLKKDSSETGPDATAPLAADGGVSDNASASSREGTGKPGAAVMAGAVGGAQSGRPRGRPEALPQSTVRSRQQRPSQTAGAAGAKPPPSPARNGAGLAPAGRRPAPPQTTPAQQKNSPPLQPKPAVAAVASGARPPVPPQPPRSHSGNGVVQNPGAVAKPVGAVDQKAGANVPVSRASPGNGIGQAQSSNIEDRNSQTGGRQARTLPPAADGRAPMAGRNAPGKNASPPPLNAGPPIQPAQKSSPVSARARATHQPTPPTPMNSARPTQLAANGGGNGNGMSRNGNPTPVDRGAALGPGNAGRQGAAPKVVDSQEGHGGQIDFSTLPPGLAASLARLAEGTSAAAPGPQMKKAAKKG